MQYNEVIDPVRDIQVVDQQIIEKVSAGPLSGHLFCITKPAMCSGQDLQTCVKALHAIEENVVRGFDGLSNEFRFETLLRVYACLAGRPYTYQQFVGSIAKKNPVVTNPAQGLYSGSYFCELSNPGLRTARCSTGIPIRYQTWTPSELDIIQDLHVS